MFDDHYEIFLADTQEGKEIHYALRYQVYCQERGYMDQKLHPAQQETDQYDDHAIHFIARIKGSGQWIGALRVAFKTEDRFPLETYCQIDKDIIDTPECRAAEISRLCIAKEVRHHNADNIQATREIETDNNNRKNSERNITWGLLKAGMDFSLQNDIPRWYVLCTNSLARMFSKKGIKMERRGDGCIINGERFVFEMSPTQMITCPFWQVDFKNSYRLYSELK